MPLLVGAAGTGLISAAVFPSPATAPRLVKVGGLFQRASIVSGFTWLTALSARALSDGDRATRSSRRPIT